MLTRSEKTYLALTLAFLAAGWGLKAWRRATVRLGPFPDSATLAQDSAQAADSLARASASPPVLGDRGVLPASNPASAGGDSSDPASSERPPAGRPPISGRKTAQDEAGPAGKIDLNRADADGLMRIKGVGEKTAQAILAYRRAHGPFREVRDLLQIKGIGEKKLEKLAPHIIL